MKSYFNILLHLKQQHTVCSTGLSVKNTLNGAQFYTTLEIMLALEITKPTKLLLYIISENNTLWQADIFNIQSFQRQRCFTTAD